MRAVHGLAEELLDVSTNPLGQAGLGSLSLGPEEMWRVSGWGPGNILENEIRVLYVYPSNIRILYVFSHF